MASDGLIQPAGIPGVDIDCNVLDTAASEFISTADAIFSSSEAVLTAWSGLSAAYVAPEAANLLSAMGPAGEDTRDYAAMLSGIGGAVRTLAEVIQPHVQELKSLQTRAEDFVAKVAHGVTVQPWEPDHPAKWEDPLTILKGVTSAGPAVIEWNRHGPTNDENTALLHEVNRHVAAILDAQADFHSTLMAHVDRCLAGPPTASAEDLNATRELPWGHPMDKQTAFVEGFGLGFIGAGVDTVEALATLLVGWMWDPAASGAAWSAVGESLGAVGVGILQAPGYATVNTKGWDAAKRESPLYIGWLEDTREWQQEQMQSVVEGFVGSPQDWEDNPSHASGGLAFNLLSILLPTKGASAALKGAGLAADGPRLAALKNRLQELSTPVSAGVAGAAQGLLGGTTKAGTALKDLAETVRSFNGPNTHDLGRHVQASLDSLAEKLRLQQPAFAGVPDLRSPAFHSVADTSIPADTRGGSAGGHASDSRSDASAPSRLDEDGSADGDLRPADSPASDTLPQARAGDGDAQRPVPDERVYYTADGLPYEPWTRREYIAAFPDAEAHIAEAAARHGLTMADVHRLVHDYRASALTRVEARILLDIRESIPLPATGEIMQKILSPEIAELYLTREFDGHTVGGFVTRAADTQKLTGTEDFLLGLGLDFKDSPFLRADGTPTDMYAIRFTKSDDLPVDIPDRTLANRAGEPGHYHPKDMRASGRGNPYLGNGFVGRGQKAIIPEYHVNGLVNGVPDGAEMWRIAPDGSEQLVGTLRPEGWLRVR